MARYAFDIETNGLLDTMNTIHSLVLTDVDTGEVFSCHDQGGEDYQGPIPTIQQGLKMLMEADLIIGHNIIGFDIPAVQLLYPWFTPDQTKVYDTLIVSRLIWSDLMDRDARAVQSGVLQPKMRGRHSLESWGQRLGKWKGDYSADMKAQGLDPWAEWNQEMQDYCVQDVEVTVAFWNLIQTKDPSPQSLELEHMVAFIVQEQIRYGFMFDFDASLDLLKTLQEERADIESKLQTLFDPWYSLEEVKTPARSINYKDLERHSHWGGATYSKIKLNVFNPGSRAHIADRLMKVRGWHPSEFTNNGQPKIDDEILGSLPYPEAQQIAYYLMLQKRLGQVYEGKNSWINLFNKETGRMHGGVVTNGAVTGRMTHNYPNVAQTPTPLKPFGAECRSLWTVPKGKKLVGVDVSGLELRMLAHFMAPFDAGEYGRTVIDGDIHTVNMNAAGLTERNQAKTFIYAFLKSNDMGTSEWKLQMKRR